MEIKAIRITDFVVLIAFLVNLFLILGKEMFVHLYLGSWNLPFEVRKLFESLIIWLIFSMILA